MRYSVYKLLIGTLLLAMVYCSGAVASYPTGSVKLFLPLVSRPLQLQASTDLPASWASHLGGAGSDNAAAVEIDAFGRVIWAGSLSADPPQASRVDLLGGGPAVVLVFNADRSLRFAIHLGAAVVANSTVTDLQVIDDQLVVCGNWGVAVIDYLAPEVLWSANPGPVLRCSLASDGAVAAALLPDVIVYDRARSTQQRWSTSASIGDPLSFDLVLHAQQVIVTGYKQKSANVQVAFLNAWNYSGQVLWRGYDFTSDAVLAANLGADTRGRRVAIGADGLLYFTGRADGSNAVFTRDPQNLAQTVPLVKTDAYNDPYNNAATITWFGRFNPLTGAFQQGQFLLTRLSSGKGNTIKPLAIAADTSGNVYLAGDTACCLPNRAALSVAAQPVGPYASGEGFFAVISADFKTRYIWTSLAGSGGAGNSPINALAVNHGTVALAATLTSGRFITTNDAFYPDPIAASDGYLLWWDQ